MHRTEEDIHRDARRPRPRRRGLWPLLGVAVLALALAALAVSLRLSRTRPPDRPNVLVVLVDALRADRLGCYGHAAGSTPEIDELAERSLFFENAFSNAPSTVRSVASLFTSTLPFVHRISQPPGSGHNQSVLADRMILIPEILREQGYYTAMVTASAWITPEVHYDQGVDEYVVGERADSHRLRAALDFFSRRAQDRRRFFLYLHFLDLHDYYHSTNLFPPGKEIPPTVSEQLLALEGLPSSEIYRSLRVEPQKYSPRDAEYLLAAYDEMLAETDLMIGDLVDTLKSLDLLDNTLVILTSDHGEQFLEHGHLVHGGDGFFNEVLHIPLIFSSPGFEERTTIAQPVSSIDVLPTLLDLLAIERPEELQGRSVRPPAPSGNTVLATNERTWKILTAEWSYIFSERYEREELYHLKEDPGESKNLVAERPAKAQELRRALAAEIRNGRRHVYLSEIEEVSTIDMSDQVEQTLRSLGYLQ